MNLSDLRGLLGEIYALLVATWLFLHVHLGLKQSG